MTEFERETAPSIRQKAANPGLVEHFRIENLHGYRSVSMDTPHSASILIAQNGAGKTTLIGALNAVLQGHYARLQNIQFDFIEIKFANSNIQRIWKSDIDEFIQTPLKNEFMIQASRYEVAPQEFFDYLTQIYNREESRKNYYTSTTIIDKICGKDGYNLTKALDTADSIVNSLYDGNEALGKARREIAANLRDIEILYLPTYRRIELALADDQSGPRRRRPNLKFATDSLFAGTIQFGLSDISEQLAQLNRNIVEESNEGYRRISANIIDDLIGGRFPNNLPSKSILPSQEELRVFFSRISNASRHGPFYPVEVPNFDHLQSTKDDSTSNQFLSYFLGYLNDVISVVKGIEDLVTQFIDTCNGYLGSVDPSTEINMARRYRSPPLDPKELVLDRSDLSVSVQSVLSGVQVPLDSLSSGEKQMISLFAKMYLYPNQKIVLIDEPELSLSLDWQTQILPDILSAPSCRQLIAITHSPFVFENSLERFAGAIDLKLSNSKHVKSPF